MKFVIVFVCVCVCMCVTLDMIHFSLDIRLKVQWKGFSFSIYGLYGHFFRFWKFVIERLLFFWRHVYGYGYASKWTETLSDVFIATCCASGMWRWLCQLVNINSGCLKMPNQIPRKTFRDVIHLSELASSTIFNFYVVGRLSAKYTKTKDQITLLFWQFFPFMRDKCA